MDPCNADPPTVFRARKYVRNRAVFIVQCERLPALIQARNTSAAAYGVNDEGRLPRSRHEPGSQAMPVADHADRAAYDDQILACVVVVVWLVFGVFWLVLFCVVPLLDV